MARESAIRLRRATTDWYPGGSIAKMSLFEEVMTDKLYSTSHTRQLFLSQLKYDMFFIIVCATEMFEMQPLTHIYMAVYSAARKKCAVLECVSVFAWIIITEILTRKSPGSFFFSFFLNSS